MFTSFSRTVLTHAKVWWFIPITILLVALVGCDGTENQENQRNFDALSSRLSSLKTDIEEQTTVLQQILDRLSPPDQVDAFSKRLNSLETDVEGQTTVLQQILERVSLPEQLDALTDQLKSLETDVRGQSTRLEQILDHVSPPQLSADWENRLDQLEASARGVNQWPKDAGEAEEYFEQTAELVASLPVWAEADYLRRLNVVRWSAMAFERLHGLQRNQHSLDELEEIVLNLRDLAEAKPDGVSEALSERLRESASEVAAKAANQRVTEAIEEAQSFLESNSEVKPEIIELYEFLEVESSAQFLEIQEETGVPFDANVKFEMLRDRLYNRIMRGQAAEQAAALTAQWQNLRKLPNHQPLYEMSVRMLLQRVMSVHTALVLEGITTTAYDELERELNQAVEKIESQVAKRQAQAMRSYQRWALSKIKKFETAFEVTKEKAREAASILRPDDGGWSDAYYREVRYAMIENLLPINLPLLDLPVQKRFHEAFQAGWRKLDGREDQTAVAQRSALIVKKSLREFMDEQK